MSEFIGPSLPGGLSKTQQEEGDLEVNGPHGDTYSFSFGPQLPPHLSKREKKVDQTEEDAEDERLKSDLASAHYGPILSSTLKTSTSDNDSIVATGSNSSYGPMLPPGFVAPRGRMEGGRGEGNSLANSRIIGPSLPPGVSVAESEGDKEAEKEDDEVIGPMPVMGGVSKTDSSMRRKKEIESRANAMKDKLLGKVAIQLHIIWLRIIL